MTYTYAVLEVPRAVYAAVRALLTRADYQHAIHVDGDGSEVIDMHGIALQAKGSLDTMPSGLLTLMLAIMANFQLPAAPAATSGIRREGGIRRPNWTQNGSYPMPSPSFGH